jgi:hypothetical protein
MPEFSDLPPTLQIAATMAIIIFGGGIAFFGYTKKWLDSIAPKERSSTDAVVVSGAFADTKPIADLTHAVRMLMEHVEQGAIIAEGHRRCLRDNTEEMARKIDSDARLGQKMDRLSDALTAALTEAGKRMP